MARHLRHQSQSGPYYADSSRGRSRIRTFKFPSEHFLTCDASFLTLTLAATIAFSALRLRARDGGIGGLGVRLSSTSATSRLRGFTLNLRYRLFRNLAIEPEAGWYLRYFRDFLRRSDAGPNAFDFGANALILVPSRRFDLFGGTGLGAQLFRSPSDDATLTGTAPRLSLPGGRRSQGNGQPQPVRRSALRGHRHGTRQRAAQSVEALLRPPTYCELTIQTRRGTRDLPGESWPDAPTARDIVFAPPELSR